MNPFKCTYGPFTCDYSVFLEQADESGKVRRWIECIDHHYAVDPRTGKMRWFESESFTLVVDGDEIMIRKGDLCVRSRSDWWEEYKKSEE